MWFVLGLYGARPLLHSIREALDGLYRRGIVGMNKIFRAPSANPDYKMLLFIKPKSPCVKGCGNEIRVPRKKPSSSALFSHVARLPRSALSGFFPSSSRHPDHSRSELRFLGQKSLRYPPAELLTVEEGRASSSILTTEECWLTG